MLFAYALVLRLVVLAFRRQQRGTDLFFDSLGGQQRTSGIIDRDAPFLYGLCLGLVFQIFLIGGPVCLGQRVLLTELLVQSLEWKELLLLLVKIQLLLG